MCSTRLFSRLKPMSSMRHKSALKHPTESTFHRFTFWNYILWFNGVEVGFLFSSFTIADTLLNISTGCILILPTFQLISNVWHWSGLNVSCPTTGVLHNYHESHDSVHVSPCVALLCLAGLNVLVKGTKKTANCTVEYLNRLLPFYHVVLHMLG